MFDQKFYSYFIVQNLGAYNDNIFRNALILLITFKSWSLWGLNSAALVSLSGAVFILPFFLFSTLSGAIADQYSKGYLIYLVKAVEIFVCLLASLGFFMHSLPILLLTLFLMGTQSTLFGPLKYSILPELVSEQHLLKANGWIQMGTFLSILLGTLTGGLLVSLTSASWEVGIGLILFSVLGFIASFPLKDHPAHQIKVHKSNILIFFRTHLTLMRPLFFISWFWLIGSLLLALFAPFVREVIEGSELMATLLLTLFSIGVGIGSFFCARLVEVFSRKKIVSAGSWMMSLGILLLALVGQFVPQFFSLVCLSLILLSLGGGMFIVPFYSLIQEKSPLAIRARVIACNNILNSLFMVIAAILLAICLNTWFSVLDIFYLLFVAQFFFSMMVNFVDSEFFE